MEKNEQELRQIRGVVQSIHFDSMHQAKRVMERLVYEYKWPSVNDLLSLVYNPYDHLLLDFGDCYCWTDLKHDILSNKYGAAYRKDSKTGRAYFVLQLPVPERVCNKCNE